MDSTLITTEEARVLTVKRAITAMHVTTPHGKENGRSVLDNSERTVTVVLPTAT